mgnify:CR=1 FL=1
MRPLWILLAGLLWASPLTAQPLGQHAIDVPRAVGEAIHAGAVGIHYVGSRGTVLGSGMALADGYILTAAHVVGCTDVLFVKGLADQKKRKARVVAIDDGADLALLHVKLPRKTPLTGVAIAETQPRRADPVFGWGRMTSIAAGQVTSGSARELDVRIPLRRGDSGGALLTPEGRLVGVLSRVSVRGVGADMVPLETVRAFLEGADRMQSLGEAELCARSRVAWLDLFDAVQKANRGWERTALMRLEALLEKEPAPGLALWAHELRARIFLRADEPARALAETRWGLATVPGDLRILRLRLRALWTMKDWPAVRRGARELLAHDVGDPNNWKALLASRRGDEELEAQVLAELDGLASDATGRDRGELLAVRCSVALWRKQTSRALEDCEAAIGEGFALTWMHDALARIHDKRSHYEQAVAHYVKSLALGSGRLDTARRCARLLVVLGRDSDALDMLQGYPLEEGDVWTALVASIRLGLPDAERHMAHLLEIAKRPERYTAMQEHLAAGGVLGNATESGGVELIFE